MSGYPLTPNVIIQNQDLEPDVMRRQARGRDLALQDDPTKVDMVNVECRSLLSALLLWGPGNGGECLGWLLPC